MKDQLEITALPALVDNYIWAASSGTETIIVDPGEAKPVLDFLTSDRSLSAILLTHKHSDHIDGLAELVAAHPQAKVYAPAHDGNLKADTYLANGDTAQPFTNANISFAVHATPGHTQGHISYVGGGALFCGDALFSCGCGRLFEGNGDDLATCMTVFANLAGDVQVCCGHEYTLANIKFAQAVDSANDDLNNWARQATELIAAGKPTVPVRLEDERKRNPFLRAEQPTIMAAASHHAGRQLHNAADVLGTLRNWKDNF